MKTKHLFLTVMAALAMITVSCSKDSNDPADPVNKVPDPEGTVELNMLNAANGYTKLDEYTIYIDSGNNFRGDGGGWYGYNIVDLGPMNGVGNITRFTTVGGQRSCAVVPGHGYLIFPKDQWDFPSGEKAYLMTGIYRVYVVSWILSAYDTILGAKIKYQHPFNLYGLPLTLEEFHAVKNSGKLEEVVTNEYPEVLHHYARIRDMYVAFEELK